MAFALQWVTALVAAEGVRITPDVKDAVWSALKSLASAPKEERTLTGLAVLIQSSALMAALTPYTLDGAYGRLLDGAAERIATTDALHIEMEELMGQKALIAPVLTYLFHRLEARFDGRPSLLVLDEAWTFLDDAIFAARIREWLKTLRKKNVAVVFASQSLADIERSSIAPALIESCPTRIFLPNDRAREPQASAIYERFGLNDRQIEILSLAAPKRDYYAQTARGNRLFELGLGPVALAVCGAGSPDDQRLIDRCLGNGEAGGFANRFLRAKDLGWAADLLARWAAPVAPAKPSSAKAEPQVSTPATGEDAVATTTGEVAAPAPPSVAIPEPPRGKPEGKVTAPATPALPAPAGKPALASARSRRTPLPGLPGGPPLPERLSPFRIVAVPNR
jgi:type IV secretion system protein VirB4